MMYKNDRLDKEGFPRLYYRISSWRVKAESCIQLNLMFRDLFCDLVDYDRDDQDLELDDQYLEPDDQDLELDDQDLERDGRDDQDLELDCLDLDKFDTS